MNKNLIALLRILGPYGWQYGLSTFLLMGSMYARSLEPRVLQVLVDNVYHTLLPGSKQVAPNHDFIATVFAWVLPDLTTANLTAILWGLAGLYFLISVCRGGLLFGSSALKESATERAINNLRNRAFAHIQQVPLTFFDTVSKGELVQRCTGDIDTVRNFYRMQINAVFRLSFSLGFGFLMMLAINWQYAVISVALAPTIVLLGFVFFQREQKVWQEHEAEADRLSNLVQENLNGIRVVAAFANEDLERKRFDKQNRRKRAMGLKQAELHSWYYPISDFLVNLQVAISLLTGGYFALSGRISIGELLAFYTYINQIAWPMREIGRLLSQLGMAFVAMGRLTELLDADTETDTGKLSPTRLTGDIEFSHVSFGYEAGEQTLTDLSFHIRPGERVALIGPTGSGKSTVVKLLLRLYEPTSGTIYLDNQPVGHYKKVFLRTRIGVALQRAFLFSTTMRSNMAYARPDSSDEAVEEVAQLAQAHGMKTSFPNGYQTVVGEKGVMLSGGQKQRIALARTLLPEPDILVLDDTTSAVDTLTEHAIFEALAEPMHQKTTLIISHRVMSIQQADRILVLENGRLVQQGTPDELARQPGYYQTIVNVQSDSQ